MQKYVGNQPQTEPAPKTNPLRNQSHLEIEVWKSENGARKPEKGNRDPEKPGKGAQELVYDVRKLGTDHGGARVHPVSGTGGRSASEPCEGWGSIR